MLKFLNNGRTLVGVPKRDLTDEEAEFYEDKFGWEKGSILANSGAYEYVEDGQTEEEAKTIANEMTSESENEENGKNE